MRPRGRKPKPSHLRLVDGTHRPTRHATGAAVGENSTPQASSLEKPRYLKRKATQAWKEFIEPAVWLDRFRVPAAVCFCELWAEFIEQPDRFTAARHSQMRAFMAELGLTDERNRPAVRPVGEPDEFFHD